MRGKYEKVSFLALKPTFIKNKEVRKKTLKVSLTQIKHLLKKIIERKMKYCCYFFLPFRPSLFAFLSSIDVDLTYLLQHSVCKAKKIIMK